MIDFFLNDFMGRALLAVGGMGCVSSVMGCFLLWRRMSFFGDAMAHAAILGVSLGTVLNANLYLFVCIVCLFTSLIIGKIPERTRLSADTWLAATSYTSMALGMIILSQSQALRIDPESILFGDILSVNSQDLILIYCTALLVWGVLIYRWQAFMMMIMDEELALIARIPVTKLRLAFTFCLAMVIAVGIKASGALLLPALMILPAATAAPFSKTPEMMVGISTLISLFTMISGIFLSFSFDLPCGPVIVMVSCFFFVLSLLSKRF